jgi:hypothetical protein
MRSFHYRPGKAALGGVFMAALAIGAGKLWWDGSGWVLLMFALLMGAAAIKIAFDVANREPLLRFDRHSLWVRKTFGSVEEIAWRDVHDISAKVFTMRYAGIIPVSRTEYLTITCAGGAFGARRLRVTTAAMELPAGGLAELLYILQAAHVEAVGVAGVAMAGAGRHGWGSAPANVRNEEQESGFDPDAAIARYLASKEVGQSEPAQVPVSRPPMPQRPAFGRRVS